MNSIRQVLKKRAIGIPRNPRKRIRLEIFTDVKTLTLTAETFNLNETGDVFKQEHDLPRRVEENGKAELEFKFAHAQKGCYFTKRETNVL